MAGFFLYQYDADLLAANPVGYAASLPDVLNELRFISIPDGIQIDTDVGMSFASVTTQKRDGLQAGFGYSNALGDEFDGVTQIDTAFTGHRAAIGPFKHCYLQPESSAAAPGRLTTTGIALGGTLVDYVLLWDIWELELQDSMDAENAVGDRVTRLIPSTVDPDDIIVRVSADNGGSFDAALHGIPGAPTVAGSTLRVQFETKPAETRKIRLGSWTLLYNTV